MAEKPDHKRFGQKLKNVKCKRQVQILSAAACIAAASSHRNIGPKTMQSQKSNMPSCLYSLPSMQPSTCHNWNMRGGASASGDDENRSYYEILGIHQSASAIEIKKAYRRKAVQTHPDKTGDRTEFDLVSEAHEVLSDETKKALYDRFGKDGVKNGGPSPSSSFFQQDILRSFFGASSFPGGNQFGNDFSSRRRPAAHRNQRYQLEVTLEELYHGTTKKVSIPIPKRQNPYSVDSTQQQHKNMEVIIPPGCKSGHRITLPGEIDYIDPNATPGDAIFIIVQKSHAVYSRKNADLAMECEITLKDAICGFQKTILFLDGSHILMSSFATLSKNDDDYVNSTSKSAIHEMIQNNDVRVLKGKGMPTNNGKYGDLYVQFKVVMPGQSSNRSSSSLPNVNTLTSEERKELGRLLDKLYGLKAPASDDIFSFKNNVNNHILEKAKASDFGKTRTFAGNDRLDDEFLNRDEEDMYTHERLRNNPFFGSSKQFFSYSTQTSGGRNPFFAGHDDVNETDEGGEHMHCQQM